MANRNTSGFGLIPTGTLGSTPATGGQGKYYIVAAYGTTLYNGTTVNQTAGYVITAQAAITNTSIGVLNGVFYNAATTLKPTWSNHYVQVTPANSEDITAFVYDNPQQLYVVSTDKLLAQAGYLETYDMNASAGSTTTGKSSATLDIDDTSADAATWRLLRLAEDPSNSDMTAIYTSVVVVLNLIELQS
jgi:hypothetical protein